MIPSFYPTFLFVAYKEYLQAEGKNRRANILTLMAVILNVVLNYIFVIFLPFDVWGLALGTNLCRWFMLIGLIYPRAIFVKGQKPSFLFEKKELIRLGIPVSCSFLLEVGAFSLTTFLAGRFGELQVSAHQIVLTWASLTFMIPLGVSSGVSTLIGHSWGSQQYTLMKWQMKASLLVSGLVMTLTAMVFFFFPQWPLKFFTKDPSIIQLGTHFFMVAAFFQIFDGLQVTLSGILRGFNKTKATFVANILSFWAVAIPVGLYLAYKKHMQVEGLWMGLAIGLLVATIILSLNLSVHWRYLSEQIKLKRAIVKS
jgi:MATE family multidrug resistance protein